MSAIPPWQQPSGYSNYPRDPYSGDPNRRPPGIYFDYIGRAWNLVQSNLATWVLSVLVGGVFMGVILIGSSVGINILLYGSLLHPGFALVPFVESTLLGLIPNGIVGIFSGSLLYMGVKQARYEQIEVGDIFVGFSCAVPLMVATVLVGLATIAGYVLLIVPGIFLTGALVFVPILVIDQKMNPIQAISVSFSTLYRHAWAMLGLLFVTGLVVALGYCMCLVGILFTLPVYLVTVGLTYNNFFPQVGPSQPIVYNQQIGTEPPR